MGVQKTTSPDFYSRISGEQIIGQVGTYPVSGYPASLLSGATLTISSVRQHPGLLAAVLKLGRLPHRLYVTVSHPALHRQEVQDHVRLLDHLERLKYR